MRQWRTQRTEPWHGVNKLYRKLPAIAGDIKQLIHSMLKVFRACVRASSQQTSQIFGGGISKSTTPAVG